MKKEKWNFVFLLFIIMLLSATFVSAAFSFSKITGRATDTGNLITNFFNKIFGIKSDASTQGDFSEIALQSPGGTATRSLPSTYTPGTTLSVSINVVPDATVGVYAVEDLPPNGGVVSNINNGGSYSTSEGKVKWGLFFDNSPRLLSYDITPPISESGTKIFSGIYSYDGVDETIGGASSISNLIPFDYTLSVPATTITQGSTSSQTVTITTAQGTAQAVTVAIGTLPTEVTLTSANSLSCTPTTGSCSVTFTYSATTSAEVGTSSISYTGTSSGVAPKSGTFPF